MTLGYSTPRRGAGTPSAGSSALASREDHVHPLMATSHMAANWYPCAQGVIATSAALPANSIRLLPFFLFETLTISDLGARIIGVVASGNIQLAIYAAAPGTLKPTGTALASTTSLSTASATTVSATLSSNVVLQAGTYWMAVNADATAGGTVTVQTFASTWTQGVYVVGGAALSDVSTGSGTAVLAYNVAQTFNTWPDLTATAFTAANTTSNALVFFKVASVP